MTRPRRDPAQGEAQSVAGYVGQFSPLLRREAGGLTGRPQPERALFLRGLRVPIPAEGVFFRFEQGPTGGRALAAVVGAEVRRRLGGDQNGPAPRRAATRSDPIKIAPSASHLPRPSTTPWISSCASSAA